MVNCFYEVKILHNDEEYLLRIPGYEKELMENVFSFKEDSSEVKEVESSNDESKE